MTRVISIQPSMTPDMRRPYPFFIVGEGEGSGLVLRQDFWKGEPYALMGFQDAFDVQHVDLHVRDFLAEPEKAVGKYPVFSDGNTGGFYAYVVAVESVHAYQDPKAADEIAVTLAEWAAADALDDEDTDSADAGGE